LLTFLLIAFIIIPFFRAATNAFAEISENLITTKYTVSENLQYKMFKEIAKEVKSGDIPLTSSTFN